ncbi:MAG: hypothetical protein JW787_08235 [Sedimentisphaerales bacterium]|nr:hypothetical protein [Sedimentisphaerales bacterium]
MPTGFYRWCAEYTLQIIMFIVSQFRFCFVAFFFTVLLIIAVSLRNANNRIFYELCTYRAQVNQLKQEIGVKQLRFESLTNPTAIQQRLDELKEDS